MGKFVFSNKLSYINCLSENIERTGFICYGNVKIGGGGVFADL